MTRTLIALLCALAVARPLAAQSPTGTVSPELVKLLHDIKAADAGQLAVSEEGGRFLCVMVASGAAKQALEIGTAFGYSAIWIGLGLRHTGGHLTTIEYDAARAKNVADNIRCAGLADVVTVVVGDGFKEIARLTDQRFFDLVFPRLRPYGLFLAHTVVNKQTEMRDFLGTIQNGPKLFTTIVMPSGEGMSVSYKLK